MAVCLGSPLLANAAVKLAQDLGGDGDSNTDDNLHNAHTDNAPDNAHGDSSGAQVPDWSNMYTMPMYDDSDEERCALALPAKAEVEEETHLVPARRPASNERPKAKRRRLCADARLALGAQS